MKRVMTFWKTPVEKLSFVMLIVTIITIALLIARQLLLGFIGIVILAFLWWLWYRLGSEEYVISFLKERSGRTVYDVFIQKSPSNIIHALSRLEKKSIVKIKDGIIILVERNHACAFDKFRRKKG